MLNKKLSILSNASKVDVVSDPYPHLVVKNAMDPDVFKQLESEYPTPKKVFQDREMINNKLYQYSAKEVLEDQEITPLWREFFDYHCSQTFFQEVITFFGDLIATHFPTLEEEYGKRMEEFSTGVRFRDEDTDVIMDCQFGMNTPVKELSRVRGPHVDNPLELYAGLLYFRYPEDTSTGGNLTLQRWKTDKKEFIGKAEVDDSLVEEVTQVQYEANTLAFFINTIDSLHGVSDRSVTEIPRRYVNIIGEFHKPLYSLKPYRASAQKPGLIQKVLGSFGSN